VREAAGLAQVDVWASVVRTAMRKPSTTSSSFMLADRMLRRLLRQVRDVNETGAHGGAPLVRLVHQAIEHVVADKGAGRLRHRRRQARFAQLVHDGLDRQGGEVGGGSAVHDRLVHQLALLVVGNRRVIDVDGDALDDMSTRPPAWPTAITILGCSSSTAWCTP
jgi:hypothetical protein